MMNPYLSIIAERSTQADNHSLSPTTRKPSVFDGKPTIEESEDFQETEFINQNPDPTQTNERSSIKSAINTQDDAQSLVPTNSPKAAKEKNDFQQNEFIEKKLEPLRPDQIPLENSSEIKNNQEDNQKAAYFSRHVERQNNLIIKSLSHNNHTETDGGEVEKLLNEDSGSTVSSRSNSKDYNAASNIMLPKKESNEQMTPAETITRPEFLIPTIENKNKLISNKLSFESIIPNLEDDGRLHNKKSSSSPTLVIGKITVEILPPKPNVPPKIITKVLPSTSNQGQTKSNKLIFGLGQM